MAIEFPRVALPPLPPSLRRLWFYLADRDVGPPSAIPVPGAIATTATTPEVDTLEWAFSEQQAPGEVSFRRADGFLLAVDAADTAEPWIAGAIFRLSIQARGFVMPGWPNSTARSYALATYRNTWQGEQATGWVQPVGWKNIT